MLHDTDGCISCFASRYTNITDPFKDIMLNVSTIAVRFASLLISTFMTI